MTYLIFNTKRILLTGIAIGAFSSMVMLPNVSMAQNCGVLGLVTCSDYAGGPAPEPAPAPAPAPAPEPDDPDDCGDCEGEPS